MDATLEGSIAVSPTGRGFGVVTRPQCRFVSSDAGHGDFDLTLGVRELFDFYDFHWDVPRSNWFEIFIFGNDADRVVAPGFAGMLAVGGVIGKVTNLLARWTISLMAVMRVSVMTL